MYHFRFTPDDISGYTFDFLESYDRYILAWEDKDKYGRPVPKHYHTYVETSYGEKSVRDAIKTDLKIPSAGRGKNNKYYAFQTDWKDPGYVCKYDNIIRSKGFTEKQILEYVVSGRKKYLKKVDGGELSGEVAPAPQPRKQKPMTHAVIIGEATTRWYAYKRDNDVANHTKRELEKALTKIICEEIIKSGKGISPFQVRDYANAVLFSDIDYKDRLLEKLSRDLL